MTNQSRGWEQMGQPIDVARLIREQRGALCEVMTMENRLLFVGSLTDGRLDANEICVELHKGGRIPLGIIHRMEVKVRVHVRGGDVVLLLGEVTRSGSEFCWLEVQEITTRPERRENFRIKVQAQAAVTGEDGETAPCDLVDISLTGLCFSSRMDYQIGEKLTIHGLQLRRAGTVYELDCHVCRTAPDQACDGRSLYGCRFSGLTGVKEDWLCRDIFALQARGINRRS